jgi:2,3-diketo-5-methylthio-1-phosphopentane phosphatase
LARQIDLVRATPEELDSVVEDVPLDPYFSELVALCRSHGVKLTVISDGLDRIIKKMLARAGVDVPVLANRLEWRGQNRWQLGFPHEAGDCRSQAGHCKCQALAGEPDKVRILIGDGRSDFCAAETADLVVAKGALAEHCQVAGLAYIVFGNFAGATTLIADWIGGLRRLDGKARYTKGTIHATTA